MGPGKGPGGGRGPRDGIQRRGFDVRTEGREPDEDEKKAEDEAERSDEEKDEAEEGQEEESSEEGGGSEDAETEGEGQDGEEGGSSDEDEDKKEEERGMFVEGYAATFGSPYQLWRGGGEAVYERIEPTAFDLAEMSDVILQYDHGGRVYARQSNGTLSLSLDARGLKVRASLGGTAEGRKLYEEIRGGYTTRMSFGFTVDESDFEELPEEEILGFSTGSADRCYLHTIRKVGRVYDVSAVSLPANEGTEIAARKSPAAGRGKMAMLDVEIGIALAM